MTFAWEVSDENSVIAFAATEQEAAKIGARELMSDRESVTVERRPGYDRYAEQGYVPVKVLYEDYWWFNCWQCDRRVSLLDEDEDDESNPLIPVFEGKSTVFCCDGCREAFHRELKQKENDRAEARQHLLGKFPGIEIKSIWGGDSGYPVSVEFAFPGGKYRARWDSDDKEIISFVRADVEAWNTYRASLNPQIP